MPLRIFAVLTTLALIGQSLASQKALDSGLRSGRSEKHDDAELRSRIDSSPELPFHGVYLAAKPPSAGWQSGTVSCVAVDGNGHLYEIQRGDQADPVLVLDSDGGVLHSWGKGDFEIPHGIRVDPSGNVWTVDAGSSKAIEYSATGKRLRTILIGEQPDNGSSFRGTTDIAFGPNGSIFIADGYGNARVLEYTSVGTRVRQWGKHGLAHGDFNLPHSLQIDEDGILYVADRENGRIEEFDLAGRYLREIDSLGRVYSIKLAGDALWATMGPFDQSPGAPGWLLKLDRKTGSILGHLDVAEERGGHCVDLMPSGEPIITLGNELLLFKAN